MAHLKNSFKMLQLQSTEMDNSINVQNFISEFKR